AALWCRYARTARSSLFQERAPRCTRTRAEVGASTQPHHERLMAGDVPASTFPQRNLTGEMAGQYSYVIGHCGRPYFPHPMACPSDPHFQKKFLVQMKEICVFLHSASTLGSRVYETRASPESSSTSDANTVIIGTK
ncbi:hypothetical protein TcCL_NonESM10990, partial [Trypanosoma cruzi]